MVTKKDDLLKENQTALSAAITAASIVVGLIILIVIILSERPFFPLSIDLIVSLLIISAISFITASTYFIRGSNPEFGPKFLKYCNRKGDLFLAIGWWGLFIAPIILVATFKLYIAAIIGIVFLTLAMYSLFEDGIATYALKLPIYSIQYRSFKRASERARTEGRTKTDVWICRIFYFFAALTIIGIIIVAATGG